MKINPIIPNTMIPLSIAIMMELVFRGGFAAGGGIVATGAEIGGVSGSGAVVTGSETGSGACLVGNSVRIGSVGTFSILLIF